MSKGRAKIVTIVGICIVITILAIVLPLTLLKNNNEDDSSVSGTPIGKEKISKMLLSRFLAFIPKINSVHYLNRMNIYLRKCTK